MDFYALDIETVRQIAAALEQTLDERTHKRDYLGEAIIVKGSLSKALKLPEIKRTLARQSHDLQQQGIDQLTTLWLTLSEPTRKNTLNRAGLYEPEELSWDDPRSNRRPR